MATSLAPRRADPSARQFCTLGPVWAAATPLLAAMAQRGLPDRPDRIEPRAVKRRPKPHPLLNVPRPEASEALK